MFECERGNTWLTYEDSHYGLFDLGDNEYMEVTIFPENYPGFHVRQFNEPNAKKLAATIHEYYDGWFVRKCNIDGVRIVDGYVSLEE